MLKAAARPATKGHYHIRFPKQSAEAFDQHEVSFHLTDETGDHRLRFHDYDEIYNRPGLYEQLFYERLQCQSPRRVAEVLAKSVVDAGDAVEALRVLDLGAGNGIVGEELKKMSVARLVGADIIPEACDAAYRDRPGVYDDYAVADMTALTERDRRSFAEWRFNALTTVAALGFDDIPADAFFHAVNLIDDKGWLAFTLRTDFLNKADTSGFAGMVKTMLYEDIVELHHIERYRHRLSIDGEPIFYFAVVARKRGPLPDSLRDA